MTSRAATIAAMTGQHAQPVLDIYRLGNPTFETERAS
jgi:hypothetical protein